MVRWDYLQPAANGFFSVAIHLTGEHLYPQFPFPCFIFLLALRDVPAHPMA
jgi:hypothetical protein